MTETIPRLRSDFADLAAPGIEMTITDKVVALSKIKEDGGFGPHFNAYILDSDPHAVNFSIKTIGVDGARDPYFRERRASDLAARAIKYLGTFHDIDGINFSWVTPSLRSDKRSDNYTTYLKARNDFRKIMPDDEAMIKAAYETWTVQKIALPNGFTRVADVFENGMIPDYPGEVSGTVWKE